MAEFDRLGRDAFLKHYGFGPSRYLVQANGHAYDAKALLAAAHGYQYPDKGPLAHHQFSGVKPTAKQLRILRLDFIDRVSPTGKNVRCFGEILGIHAGTRFEDRQALADAGVHGQIQAGITGSQYEGADSIVVSGGYEDDEDLGDTIIYTGHGGQDSAGRQVANQEFTKGNLALAKSGEEGLPVRVTRGATPRSPYAPDSGYRYDGLFFVDNYWHEIGKAGFRVWRYRLMRAAASLVPNPDTRELGHLPPTSSRSTITIQRIIRSTAVSRRVKEIHDHHCQICGDRLVTHTGFYAEGAHIRPLGRPHNGPDVIGNILCLCPNHHVLFDLGAIHLLDDLTLVEIASPEPPRHLRTAPSHPIEQASIQYHREHIGLDEPGPSEDDED
jgi:putative restriction endonuclease